MSNSIMVSIICNAYNHEKYIRDALESFIMQKTNFKFEVLIHDDASTDKTADIIREYEKKYPDLVKPIYQTENQYSQEKRISYTYQFPRVKGKYIAVCEGDDYWTDPYKLQRQFDAMEKHPEINICAHMAVGIDAESKKTIKRFPKCEEDTIFSVEQVILGGGGFVATNSLFYRSYINEDMPRFRKNCGLDYALQIHGSLHGGMLFLKDCMSVYRMNVAGSWTVRNRKDKNFRKKTEEKSKNIWAEIDEDTNYQYSDTILEKRTKNMSEQCCNVNDLKKLKSSPYDKYYKKLSAVTKIKIVIKCYFPAIVKAKRKLFD